MFGNKLLVYIKKPSLYNLRKIRSIEDRKKAILLAADNFDAEDETNGMLGIGYY